MSQMRTFLGTRGSGLCEEEENEGEVEEEGEGFFSSHLLSSSSSCPKQILFMKHFSFSKRRHHE